MPQDIPIGILGRWRDSLVPTYELVSHPDVQWDILLDLNLCMHVCILTHIVYYFFQIRHIELSVTCITNVLFPCPFFIDEIKLYWFVVIFIDLNHCMYVCILTHIVSYFFQIHHIVLFVTCVTNVLYPCPCFIDEIMLYWFVVIFYLMSSTTLKFYKTHYVIIQEKKHIRSGIMNWTITFWASMLLYCVDKHAKLHEIFLFEPA